jgi:hypothetical protein
MPVVLVLSVAVQAVMLCVDAPYNCSYLGSLVVVTANGIITVCCSNDQVVEACRLRFRAWLVASVNAS